MISLIRTPKFVSKAYSLLKKPAKFAYVDISEVYQKHGQRSERSTQKLKLREPEV